MDGDSYLMILVAIENSHISFKDDLGKNIK